MSGLAPLWNLKDTIIYEDVRASAPMELDGYHNLRRCQG